MLKNLHLFFNKDERNLLIEVLMLEQIKSAEDLELCKITIAQHQSKKHQASRLILAIEQNKSIAIYEDDLKFISKLRDYFLHQVNHALYRDVGSYFIDRSHCVFALMCLIKMELSNEQD